MGRLDEQLIALLLAEAGGEDVEGELAAVSPVKRWRYTILLGEYDLLILSSVGTARRGNYPAQVRITGITENGRQYLDALRRKHRPKKPPDPTD
jgi:hypothetical protein